MFSRLGRRVVYFLAVALLAGAAPVHAELVDLELQPASQTTAVTSVVTIDLQAVVSGGPGQDVGAIDAIVTWDPAFLELLGLDGSNAGYAWFVSDFLNDPDGINDDLMDGTALYTALAQTTVPAVATPGGLIVTTLEFEALAETAATVVSFTPVLGTFGQTRVLAFDLPNFPITGDISSTATVEILPAIPCVNIGDCADMDDDNKRDDGCVWWACDGICMGIDIVFADMGGSFGDCPVDGVTDNNDVFHALNCFGNQDTTGIPGDTYPCEDNPPFAFNVDAGGQFGDCDPDGVCDANDSFHALNAFSDATTCACPLDGTPSPGAGAVQVVGGTPVALEPRAEAIAAGETVAVDVYLQDGLPDFRGYQLHVGVAGGRRGQLELIDVAIEPRPDHVFAKLADWRAFNVDIAQMTSGLSDPGIASAPRAYLATFTFRASPRARGTFFIDLLYDDPDDAYRTFLFGTPVNGKVEILAANAAVVRVGDGLRRRWTK